MKGIMQRLQAFDFIRLFNELGWDQLRVGLEKEVDGHLYELQPIGIKKGVQVLHCAPGPDGVLPTYAVRQKIERKVTPDAREHLIIFTDAAQTRQIWQWVARAPGRPTQYREVKWQQGQATELLEQKLKAISFDLNEEESLTVFGVAERLRGGFDRDNVTKKFYKVFQSQREAFQKFIDGIPSDDHSRWYTAVVIDRLMFLWFLQEKFFLDGDKRYLRNRLDAHLANTPETSFYKTFLCPLFFRGFAEERTNSNRAAIQTEFGNVPYLNGGLFAEHELERQYGEAIDIPDTAFASLFEFFDQWDWHLDERPLASGKEVNPDVLGYIFEKFVNQKQMGAYYTKEDITEYIAKNTIIPCLFDKVRADHAAAFDAHVWPLLQEDPRRYLYPAMLQGVDEAYPPEIEAGLDTDLSDLLERRKPWNKPAEPSHALPTEIWRETIARHDCTREVLAKLAAGEVRTVADLITYNLNIRQFAQDVIERCTDPALLRAFWVALAGRLPRRSNEKFRHGLSILDPTCGSGAFLFAGLQVLKPLYQACLTAMSGLLADAYINPNPSPALPLTREGDNQTPANTCLSGETAFNPPLSRGARGVGFAVEDFEEIVDRFYATGTDRQCDYAVLKHIIVHNLYGVDIEAQATEIAKLRLFLKLVALLEPGDDIEPLPDIDFNIRVGNTLVGYASAAETERAVMGAEQQNLFTSAWDDIRISLTAVEQSYNNFQIQQVQRGGHVTVEDKRALADQLGELEETLNGHLCREYGKNPSKAKEYKAWKASHKPFHWYVDFYPIMAAGGFDVVIGNPPYKDLKSVGQDDTLGYTTVVTKNLYPLCMERTLLLAVDIGRIGLIVPVSSISTEGYLSLQQLLLPRSGHWSSFDDRPSRLFDGLEHIQLTIHLFSNKDCETPIQYFTECIRWSSTERELLFAQLEYSKRAKSTLEGTVPKISKDIEHDILSTLNRKPVTLGMLDGRGGRHPVYYSRKVHNFLQVLDFIPQVYSADGSLREPSELKSLRCATQAHAALALCVLNSSLFRWYINVYTDCRHVNKREVEAFPVLASREQLVDETLWGPLAQRLSESLSQTSEFRSMKFKHDHLRVQCIIPKKSKSIIDEIEVNLGQHFGLSEDQIDYIINYDIKYRMGLNGGEADADE